MFDLMIKISYAILITIFFLVLFTMYINLIESPKLAIEKCKLLDLELFDYSPGRLFTQESIVCYNNKTKEVVKIK
jgi:hypothetical protein